MESPPHGATVPQWARAFSFTRFLDHTQRRTTVCRTPLNKWSARRRDLYLTTHNIHNQQTHIHAPGRIRTHNLSRKEAADLRLRPRGHWDRLRRLWILVIWNQASFLPKLISKSTFDKFPLCHIREYVKEEFPRASLNKQRHSETRLKAVQSGNFSYSNHIFNTIKMHICNKIQALLLSIVYMFRRLLRHP